MQLPFLILGIAILGSAFVSSVRTGVDIDVARTKISMESPSTIEAKCIMGGCEQTAHNGTSYCKRHYQ